MTHPKISIILPLYNSEKYIEECLKSISEQSFKDYELIIIDDFSTDKTRKILDRYGYKYYKHQKNMGFTKTVNEGIKLSKGEYVAIADHDLIYEKDYLSKMLKENKDITSCRVYYYKQKDKLRSLGIKIDLITGKTTILGRNQIDTGQRVEAKDIMAVGAAMMLVKKKVFDEVGLFNENFLHFYTDVDWCYKAGRKGFSFFPSDAKSWHKKEEHEAFSKEQLERYYQDKKRFLKKHSPYYPFSIIPMSVKKFIAQRKSNLC